MVISSLPPSDYVLEHDVDLRQSNGTEWLDSVKLDLKNPGANSGGSEAYLREGQYGN